MYTLPQKEVLTVAQQARSKKAATAEKTTMDKRLTNIETSLSEMEMQICQTKETINKIEAMLVQLQQLPIQVLLKKAEHQERMPKGKTPLHIPPLISHRLPFPYKDERKNLRPYLQKKGLQECSKTLIQQR